MYYLNFNSGFMEVNTLDSKYQDLLRDILKNGVEKKDRTGTGTISVFGRQIRHKMSEGFPLLTTKKMAIKTLMTELKWFLKGDTNIKYLVDNNCHIWDGDAYKNYEKYSRANSYGVDFLSMEEFIDEIKTNDEFAAKWGELGPIYGAQWRNWTRRTTREEKIVNPGVYTEQIDQIQNLINELKTNPDSRRLMVSAWNVSELTQMVLPPCHYGFQVYTRELNLDERIDWLTANSSSTSRDWLEEHLNQMGVPLRAISLSWNQRSVDTFLGLPFNIASYATLLELIADEVNMVPEELIGNLGDTHLYSNHIEQAKEQLSREPKPYLPKLKLSNVDILEGEFDYEVLHYHSHPTIKAPLSN
jgi:thymidylate synthase